MKKISMLTVVPANLAVELSKSHSIKNYNTLQHLSKQILEVVREYMTDNVGYSDLPMACLSRANFSGDINGESSIFNYLPVNSKESVLFQLEMPDDMIISVPYRDLLNASNEASSCVDPDELEFIKECFKENLSLGLSDSDENLIIFIPFLALDKCKFYAKFDEEFETQELNLPGIEKMDVSKLVSFYS